MTHHRKNFRHLVTTVVKLAIAAALIVWLVMSGKLDFTQLAVLIKKPEIVAAAVGYWLFCAVIVCCLRWRLLLQASGYKISFWRALQLTTVGYFFNSTMPGAVGGDLVKVYYAIKDNPQCNRSGAFMSILLDRLIGLAGIFSIGIGVVLFQYLEGMQSAVLSSIVSMMSAFLIFLLMFFGAALHHYRGDDPFLRTLKRPLFNGRLGIIRKLYEALRQYSNHRSAILYGLLLSVVNQVGSLGLFCIIAEAIAPGQMNYLAIATIFPLGMLITALPLAPGGLGVGHVAFENLFRMIGLAQGANIFNAFTLIQIALNMLGVLPYLYLKKKDKDAETVENMDFSAADGV